MNLGGIFGPAGFAGFAGFDVQDARALSNAWQAQQCELDRIQSEQQWRPTLEQQLASLEMLRPYERPVHVPQGWRDWYAIGDQLN